MSDTLNIVCFLWHGDRWDENDMGINYVNTLFRSVQRNLSLPHRFVCLTDNLDQKFEKGIEPMLLDAPSWMGCLPKVCMFNPDLGFEGQVLSFDIDVIITGSLDEIASYRGDFAVRSSFRDPLLLDGDIVGFKAGKHVNSVWLPLKQNPRDVEVMTGGRERLWYRSCLPGQIERFQTLFPGQILSYKRHLTRGRKLPKSATIVSCHGRPRPHELKEDWAVFNWR